MAIENDSQLVEPEVQLADGSSSTKSENRYRFGSGQTPEGHNWDVTSAAGGLVVSRRPGQSIYLT